MPHATIIEAMRFARKQLEDISESASLDAQLLLCEVLGVNRAYLMGHPEEAITPEQSMQFMRLIARRSILEPVAYLLGRRAFYDREFMVTPSVLIPRPETELLLEQALEFSANRPSITAVDVGTGSGALAVTFAAHRPNATVYATDISPAALSVARHNAQRYGANVELLQGDLLQPLIDRNVKVNVLMSNPPYIASDVLPELDVSRYEPHLALDGGDDGLDVVRRLLGQAREVCLPGALILLEIGADQGAAVVELARKALGTNMLFVLKDYAGHDRILRAQL